MNSEEAIVAEDTDQQVKVPLRRSTRERRTVRKPVYFSEEQHSSTQNGTRKQHGDAESSSISKEIAGEEGRMSQESSEESSDDESSDDDSSSEQSSVDENSDDDSSSEQSSVDESSDDESSNSGSSEPQDPSEYNWETEGHRFIGKRVHRTYSGGAIAQGVVEKYLPSDGEDGALFHVLHDDGDEEDLDEKECAEAIEEYRRMNVTGRYNVRNRESVKPPERFTISAISTSPGGHEKKKKKKVANRNAYERYMTDGANSYARDRGDYHGRRGYRRSNRRRQSGGRRRSRRKHYDSSSESDSDYGSMGASNFRMYEKRRERDDLNRIQPLNRALDKNVSKVSKRDITRADALPVNVDKSVSWSSVGGLQKHISALKEMVTLPLLYPEVFERFHITAPRGVIFYGPPGTGKTLVARALANSCSRGGKHVSFFMRKGADCLSKWVGEAERQLRLLFEQARLHQPSIIFFDEIDGLAPVRSSKQDQIHASIVSTLLALMDGLDDRGQVIVIGATNRIDSIDPALRRPGRFDRELLFGLPDKQARREILDIHTQHWNPPLLNSFKDDLAEECVGYCGADLKSLCTEASLIALRRRYPEVYNRNEKLLIDVNSIIVTREDFLKAIGKVVPASRRSVCTYRASLKNSIKPLLSKALYETLDILRDIFPTEKCRILRRGRIRAEGNTVASTAKRNDAGSLVVEATGNSDSGVANEMSCSDILPTHDPESIEEMRLIYGVDKPIEVRKKHPIMTIDEGSTTGSNSKIPAVGQRVRVKYNKGRGNFYVAQITRQNANGTYAVEYNDGEVEDHVKPEFIREIKEVVRKKVGENWQYTGNRFIGARVRRYFPDADVWANGTITKYLPPEKDVKRQSRRRRLKEGEEFVEGQNTELWHVEHDDGDEEDLEEFELHEAIEDHRKFMSSRSVSLEEYTGFGNKKIKRNSLYLPLGGKVTLSQRQEFYKPRLVLEGMHGNGQGQLARAILHALEEIPVFTLALSDLVAEAKNGESIDVVCLRHIVEAKRSAPCVLYIPAIDILWNSVGVQMRRIIIMALEDMDKNLPLFLLAWCSQGGIGDVQDKELRSLFPEVAQEASKTTSGRGNFPKLDYCQNSYTLTTPSDESREAFFGQIFENVVEKLNFEITMLNRTEINEQRRNKRKREVLEVAPEREEVEETESEKEKLDDEHCMRELRIFLRTVIKELWKERKFQPFFHAVDEEVVRDYYQIIKNPMDLDQIAENIDDCVYTSIELFLKDLKLIVSNAKKYNGPSADSTSLRGRQIISSANQMYDTVNSFVHRFRKRVGYNLLERCATITKKLKSKRRKTGANVHGKNASGSTLPTSRMERAKIRAERYQKENTVIINDDVDVDLQTNDNSSNTGTANTLSRAERYRLRYGITTASTGPTSANQSRSSEDPKQNTAKVGEDERNGNNTVISNTSIISQPVIVDHNKKHNEGSEKEVHSGTVAPSNTSSNGIIPGNQTKICDVGKSVSNDFEDDSLVNTTQHSRMNKLKVKYVYKTQGYTVDDLEELHARLTRTMNSYYASQLKFDVMMDELETYANSL